MKCLHWRCLQTTDTLHLYVSHVADKSWHLVIKQSGCRLIWKLYTCNLNCVTSEMFKCLNNNLSIKCTNATYLWFAEMYSADILFCRFGCLSLFRSVSCEQIKVVNSGSGTYTNHSYFPTWLLTFRLFFVISLNVQMRHYFLLNAVIWHKTSRTEIWTSDKTRFHFVDVN